MELFNLIELDEHEKRLHFCEECGKVKDKLVRFGGKWKTDIDGSSFGGDMAWACEECLKEAFDLITTIVPEKDAEPKKYVMKRTVPLKDKKFIKNYLNNSLDFMRKRLEREKVDDFEVFVEFVKPYLDEII